MEKPQVNNAQAIPLLLAAFHLDLLLHEKRLSVLHFSPPDSEPVKIIFARGTTIGCIIDKTAYIVADFFKGGRFYNAILEMEFNLIVKTYGLESAQAIPEHVSQEAAPIQPAYSMSIQDQLSAIKEIMTKEQHPEILARYCESAKNLAQIINTAEAKVLLNQILEIYEDKLTGGGDQLDNEKTMGEAQRFVAERNSDGLLVELKVMADTLEDCEDYEKILLMSDAAAELMNKFGVSADPLVLEKIKFITDSLLWAHHEKKNHNLRKIDEDNDKKTDGKEKLDQEKKYQELLTEAEKFYHKKNFQSSEKLYLQASKMFPNRNKPKEMLASIKMEKQRLKG